MNSSLKKLNKFKKAFKQLFEIRITRIFFKIFKNLEISNVINIIKNLEIFILLDKRIIE